MLTRLSRPLVAAAAVAVWAVAVPAPPAVAGSGDIRTAARLASAVEQRALAAADFGARVGLPEYLAFSNTAGAIAAESHLVGVKLAVGDVPAAQACVAKMKGLVRVLDKQEDRLPRRGFARGARKAADDAADAVEDTFKDLEDEVEDLRFVARPVVFAPPVAPRPPVVGPPACPGGGPAVSPRPAPRFEETYFEESYREESFRGGAPRVAPQGGIGGGFGGPPSGFGGGFEYQGEGDDGRGVYYGPSRGLNDPAPQLGRPTDGFDDFGVSRDRYAPPPSYGTPNYGAPAYGAPRDDFRDRDSFRPVPRYEERFEERFEESYRYEERQEGYRGAVPPLAPPQARRGSRLPGGLTVSLRR